MSTDIETIVKETVALKRPAKWVIVLHNDDTTSMEFVVELLLYVFDMSTEKAAALMFDVHINGKAVAGVYSYEMAEQKFAEAQTHIKMSPYQLVVTLEQE
jgi:ATP-dependent Clp protease adaptor protein ClpS